MENTREDSSTRAAYQRIVVLALMMHALYAVLFAFLQVTLLLFYNIGSVVFYVFMLYLIRKNFYRLSVGCIHLEVCIFVTVTALAVGWEAGGALFLVATSSLVYFCPYQRKYIPYIFSGLETCLFLCLYVLVKNAKPLYTLDGGMISLLFICSACACFAIILFASLTAKVSATTDRKALLQENESLSVIVDYDQLTGLLSRYSFKKKLEACNAGRLAFVMGDIDDFKQVNDLYGHACGDYVLREVADLMRDACGDSADICRWGGEEFLLLFNAVPDKEVLDCIKGLRRTIEKHIFLFEGTRLHVTMTFGVSFGWEKSSAAELIETADAQMYRGKKNGKNRVVIWEEYKA